MDSEKRQVVGSRSEVVGTMTTFEVQFLATSRRVKEGKLWDVIDYRFRVSSGRSDVTVAVGIAGQYHHLAEALGSKLSHAELVEAAAAWLRSRLEKRECDPFNRPERDCVIDLSSTVMDYWIEHRSIPHWL